ncbi:hypothetical protein [Halobellus rufus]|uniref:hypothetical protein n=1 Tax=Halobellus rufus TaxID=1448860 RepID=UPI000678A208|nr:hypothetical protein [Halobellus rufus]
MSAADLPISVTGTQLFVVAVAAVVIVGASPGFLVDTLQGGPGDLEPPGASDARGSATEIDVTASDPANVRDDDGTVGVVAGRLGGTVTLDRPVDRVDIVVRSRLPNGSWVVLERAAVEPAGAESIDLTEAVGGSEFVYLDRDRSSGFDVDTPGSTARREGAVSVTARVHVDGDVIDTVTDADGYAFLVDRPAATTVDAGATGSESSDSDAGSDERGTDDGQSASAAASVESTQPTDGDAEPAGGNGHPDGGSESHGTDASDGVGDGDGTDGDETDRRTLLFGTGDALPGSTGSDSAVVSNPAEEEVTATFAVGAPIDEENGITEPESAVDDTPDVGELSEHLDVRIRIETGDGETIAVGGDGFVSLADAAGASRSIRLDPDESVTVVVEWRISSDVGNEIQSDSTTLSVHGSFESTTGLSASVPLL